MRSEVLLVINLLVLLANLGVFGLSLKVYTELMKNQAMDKRSIK